jgi:uncharacterized damage-inducible protein DinB
MPLSIIDEPLLGMPLYLLQNNWNMSVKKGIIMELQFESASTKKILDRVPLEHITWKPHEKSMTLQRLATHIAELPGWITRTINSDEMNIGGDFKPTLLPNAQEITALYEKNLQEAIETLENADEALLDKPWTLKKGEHTIFTFPKKVIIRNMAMNHLVHHRGQLSVFLRLLDVPIPGMYGPSADER